MKLHGWRILKIVLLLFMVDNGRFSAAKPSEEYERGAHPPAISTAEWIEKIHARISEGILSASTRFDGFFGDERIQEEQQKTQIRVKVSVKFAEGQRSKISFPISANLSLPNLEDKVQIVVDTLVQKEDEETTAAKTPSTAEDKTETKPNDVKVSLRYNIVERARRWVNIDGGLKVHSKKLEPFGQIRIRRTFDFHSWASRVTQFVFWYENDGFGTTSRLDIDKQLHPNTFYRMTGNMTWTEGDAGMVFAQSFFLRQQLSHLRSLGIELSGKGHSHPSIVMDEYIAKVSYRRRIYKNWAFVEIAPEMRFLRENDFDLAKWMTMNLEIRLGHTAEE